MCGAVIQVKRYYYYYFRNAKIVIAPHAAARNDVARKLLACESNIARARGSFDFTFVGISFVTNERGDEYLILYAGNHAEIRKGKKR